MQKPNTHKKGKYWCTKVHTRIWAWKRKKMQIGKWILLVYNLKKCNVFFLQLWGHEKPTAVAGRSDCGAVWRYTKQKSHSNGVG